MSALCIAGGWVAIRPLLGFRPGSANLVDFEFALYNLCIVKAKVIVSINTQKFCEVFELPMRLYVESRPFQVRFLC